MNEVITIGVDLAKNVFQVHGVDAEGAVVVRRQLRRGQVLPNSCPAWLVAAAATRLVPTTTLSEPLSAMIYRRVGCVSPSITVRVDFTATQGAYRAILALT